MIKLSTPDLAIAAAGIIIVAALSRILQVGVQNALIIAALRATIQLVLIGWILHWLFGDASPFWLLLVVFIMLAAAAREVRARQKFVLLGRSGYLLNTLTLIVSSCLLAMLALTLIVSPEPWYQPQYSIPLLGMLLGNTMNGIAIAADRFTQGVLDNRDIIDQRLALGESAFKAVEGMRRDSVRSGLIPSVNGMATAGIVALPGMMTGQILAGSPPLEAVKYQLMILFLITTGTGLGIFFAVHLTSKRLIDERMRLRPDRLSERPNA